MLPIHLYNNILLAEEHKWQIMNAINRERRISRNDSDPFFMTNDQFRGLFRLTKDMVNNILFPALLPHLERNSALAISPQHKILIALNFYATGHYQNRLGLDWQFPTSQQTVSNIIHEVTPLIEQYLSYDWIKFPSEQEAINRIKSTFMQHTRFPGVIGAIDCTHIPLLAPQMQEHNYLNRKGYHSKNVQLICDYNLEILNVNARFGGAAHDAFIFSQSTISRVLEQRYNEGDKNTWLVGDSGYPQKPYLMTPILNAVAGTPEAIYTNRHVQARNPIERCNGVLKMTFRCLSGENKLRYSPDMVGNIVNVCVILHNIRVRGRMIHVPNYVDIPVEENILGIRGDQQGFEARRLLIQRYFQE